MIGNTIVISVMCANQFFHDQTRCACTSHSKVSKRIIRAEYVAKNTPPEFGKIKFLEKLKLNIISGIKKLFSFDETVSPKKMISYLESPYSEPAADGDVVLFDLPADIVHVSKCKNIIHHWMFFSVKSIFSKPNIPCDYIKKSVESFLTTDISNLSNIYMVTCNFFKKIIHHILTPKSESDMDLEKIMQLVYNNDIILELKGGMSSKMLMKLITGKTDEVDKIFSNGDNDTAIIINPKLTNFAEMHRIICTRLHDAMKILADGFFEELDIYIKEIEKKGLTINGENISLKHCPTTGFYGFDKGSKHILIYDKCRNLKIQRNELNIFDQVGCLHHFELLRIKLPFKCMNRIICGELLDISVPYDNECIIQETFDGRNQMIPVDWINM